MKHFLFFVFLFSSFVCCGQFSVIRDEEGYVNIRKTADGQGVIIDTLKNGHLIYCLDREGNWINIDYSKNGKELSGYIYNDRYHLVSKYQEVTMVADSGNFVKLGRDSIEVNISQRKFQQPLHKYKYYKEAKDLVELIDNKKYWGTDGEMPKTEYKSIIVKIGRTKITLPQSALHNLYEPTIYNSRVHFDKGKNILYIHSMNSDGAGSYEVIWKIENGKYKERFIAYGF